METIKNTWKRMRDHRSRRLIALAMYEYRLRSAGAADRPIYRPRFA